MALKVGNTSPYYVPFTQDGVPFVWSSGDIDTATSNATTLQESQERYGYSVAVADRTVAVGSFASSTSNTVLDVYDTEGTLNYSISGTKTYSGAASTHQVAVGHGRVAVCASTTYSSNTYKLVVYDYQGNGVGVGEAGRALAIGCNRIISGDAIFDRVYVYDVDCTEQYYITPPASSSNFGQAVAVGQDILIVGDWGFDSEVGIVYLYNLADGLELRRLECPESGAKRFGYNVATTSNRIYVSAPADDGYRGAVYIFDIHGNYIRKIVDPEVFSYSGFGDYRSLSAGCGRLVVGGGGYNGKTYIYDLDGNYIETLTITPLGYNFGRTTAVKSGRIVAGVLGSSTTGYAYLYDTPNVHTVYDALERQKGNM